jgi:hypothetical protein
MIRRAALAAVLVVPLLGSAAFGHGGVSIENDVCVLKLGPSTIHFTGYQPDRSFKEFCEDIPYTGRVIIVLDLVDSDLRHMSTEVRVVSDPGGGGVPIGRRILSEEEIKSADILAATEAYQPPATYPTGTVKFEHDFKRAGQYIGIVTIRNEHGQEYTSQFPFMVGPNWSKSLPFYGLSGLALGIGVFVVWKFGRQRFARNDKL